MYDNDPRREYHDGNDPYDARWTMPSGANELLVSSHDEASQKPEQSESKRKYLVAMLIATLLLVIVGAYVHSSYAEQQHQAALANAEPIMLEPEPLEPIVKPEQTLTPEVAPPPSTTLVAPPPPPPTKDPDPAPETESPSAMEEQMPAQVPSSSVPGCMPCPGGSGVYPAYPTQNFGSQWGYGGSVWVNGPAWYPPVQVRSHEVGWLWVWDCNDFYLRPPH